MTPCDDGWIEWTGGQQGGWVRALRRISIGADGLIRLSKAADMALGHPEAVILLHAPATGAVAIRPANGEPHAIRLHRSGGSSRLRAQAFVRQAALTPGTVWDNADLVAGMLVLRRDRQRMQGQMRRLS